MAAFMLVEHANGTMFSPPLGAAVYPRAVAPNRKPYRTKDGYISALVYNDKQWFAFIDAVQPGWAGEHFATLAQRARQVDTVYALLGETFLARTTQEWLDLLRSLDIPAAPVRTLDDLFNNPHLNQVEFFETVDTPNGPPRRPDSRRATLRCRPWAASVMRRNTTLATTCGMSSYRASRRSAST